LINIEGFDKFRSQEAQSFRTSACTAARRRRTFKNLQILNFCRISGALLCTVTISAKKFANLQKKNRAESARALRQAFSTGVSL
jgi:hypothetical protein